MPKDSHNLELQNKTAVHLPELPKWVLPLFVITMTLCISAVFFKSYWISGAFGHRYISILDNANEEGFFTVDFDSLRIIPNLNKISYGKFLVDPFNSYNENFKGWGMGNPIPHMVGGILVRLFGNFHIAMFMWGLLNFSLMIILIYSIFRNALFKFSQPASIVGTFLLLNLLWIGGMPRSKWNDTIPEAILTGYHPSLVQIEAGLFTYLPYFLFLVAYWRFVAAPGWKPSVFVGISAGFLTYVYFFHYVFAFAMIAGHMTLSIILRRKKETLFLAGALGVGLIMALPTILNTLLVIQDSLSSYFFQRLDYSPGRSPFQDYHWFLYFQITLLIGVAYLALRKRAEIKWIMVKTWVVLAIAYATMLNLRILTGSIQGVDHFWRYSLGIPGSLWCILAIFDLIRSRLENYEISKKVVYLIALLLPILILGRTVVDVSYALRNNDAWSQLSEMQLEVIEKLDCIEPILKPGEGFLTVDPALNYHTTANLKGLPFMAMALSTIGLDELSRRYLISAYLTGQNKMRYPPFADQESPEYTRETDLHRYLYLNLFRYPWRDLKLEKQLKRLYLNWDPEHIDWNVWADALSTVRAVYVENEYFEHAIKRLEKHFAIEKIDSCEHGKALRVKLKPVSGTKKNF